MRLNYFVWLMAYGLLVSSCENAKKVCDVAKPLVIDGYDSLAIQSQWDACIVNNSSTIALNNTAPARLVEIAYELCNSFEPRYVHAVLMSAPKMSVKQATDTKVAYSDSLRTMAKSEIMRVRTGGCVSK